MDLRDKIFDTVFEMVPNYDEIYDIRGLISDIIKEGIKDERLCPWYFYGDDTWVDDIYVRDVYLGRDDHIYVEVEIDYYDEEVDAPSSYNDTMKLFDDVIEYVEQFLSDSYDIIVHSVLVDMNLYDKIEEMVENGKIDSNNLEDFIKENYYDEIVNRLEKEIESQVILKIVDEFSFEPYTKMFCEVGEVLDKIQKDL